MQNLRGKVLSSYAIRTLRIALKFTGSTRQYFFPLHLMSWLQKVVPVRIVNEVLEKIDVDPLVKIERWRQQFSSPDAAEGFGYACINNKYFSCKIEAALKEHIHYLRLPPTTANQIANHQPI